MLIRVDDLAGAEIRALLTEHLSDMALVSPPESIHALDLHALRAPDITFWTSWQEGALVGCGALGELDSRHGEIKSMRTAKARRGQGVAKHMLAHILAEARRRSYARVSLETGAHAAFTPAHRLYAGFGFLQCGPFADYGADPHSVFMTKTLVDTAASAASE